MNKKLLPLLLALAFAFSGCLGMFEGDLANDDENDDGVDHDGDGVGDGNGNGNGNGDGDKAETQPLSASLVADLTKGEAPLKVTFSLEGSDPDGGDVEWTLDLGDDSDLVEGTDLPTGLTHSYESIGVFKVVFTVSSGERMASKDLTITVTELPIPDAEPHRFFFRGDGDIAMADPLPSGIGINGTLSLEPGDGPRAIATTGPMDSILDDDLVVFTSDALDIPFTIADGVEVINDRSDEEWTVSEHAFIHFCTRGNANGVFSASVYEVSADGERTLVLENDGKQWAGTGPITEDCEERRLSFAEAVESYTFAAGSSIQVTLSPDVFLGSIATQLLYNGSEEPYDSSLNLNGFFF